MNGKFKKITSIALILAMLLTQLCFAVIGAQAASSSEGETVYFKLPADWAGRVDTTTGETVLPAAYTAGGTSGEYVPWVGTHMTKVEGTDDIYSFVIPGDQTFIMFNTGMQRDWQTGELALSGGDMLFVVDSDIETKNAIGHWEPYNTDAPKVSIDTGTFNFVGKKDIALSRFNSTSGTYSINGGEEIPFENGQTVTIGEGVAQDTDVNLVLTASNGTDAVSYEYTFHKSPSLTIYAKNNAGWKDVYIHYWGGESTSVWPGVAMTPYQDSENVFYATELSPDASFIYSMGDQVDANQEYGQYAGFLNPPILRNLPIATTIGNHDCDVPNIQWHFNNLNMTSYGETNAGGDYYFSYGDALFINLNSNAVLKSSKSNNAIAVEHRKAIEEAIASNPYAKWRIVTFHQDIYGYPDHYDDGEVKLCREQLYPIIDDYDIDVVLTGHGHNFTRSYQIQNNEPVDNSYSFKQKSVTVNDPSGTVFFELSTAASKNYENNKPGSKGHIANSFAVNGVQSFSLVNVTGDSLSIDTYRTDTPEMYDSYTINKADRTKLDKSIEEANAIISSGKYSDDQLVELNAALQAAQSVPQNCDLVTAYDAAVALDEVIKSFDPILFGDANGDGDVMINDCILILKYRVGACEMTKSQLRAANVTHDADGTVNLEDAIKIQKYLVYMIDSLD